MPQRATPDRILGEHEKILLYGESGTGKTHLALTAPDPIYFLGIGGDNELKTLYSKPFITQHGKKEVYYDAVEDERGEKGQMVDNPQGFDNICNTIDEFLVWNAEHGMGIKTIIIDNATVMERWQMDKAIAAEFASSRGDDKAVLKVERDWGIRKPHDSTWGGAQSLMDRIATWMFELPFHIVFIAHEYKIYRTDPDKKRTKILTGVRPLFVGEQRTSIPGLFDNVWRTTTSGGGRSTAFDVQTVGDNIVSAKCRVGGIINETERNLSISAVIQQYRDHAESLKEEETETES